MSCPLWVFGATTLWAALPCDNTPSSGAPPGSSWGSLFRKLSMVVGLVSFFHCRRACRHRSTPPCEWNLSVWARVLRSWLRSANALRSPSLSFLGGSSFSSPAVSFSLASSSALPAVPGPAAPQSSVPGTPRATLLHPAWRCWPSQPQAGGFCNLLILGKSFEVTGCDITRLTGSFSSILVYGTTLHMWSVIERNITMWCMTISQQWTIGIWR